MKKRTQGECGVYAWSGVVVLFADFLAGAQQSFSSRCTPPPPPVIATFRVASSLCRSLCFSNVYVFAFF